MFLFGHEHSAGHWPMQVGHRTIHTVSDSLEEPRIVPILIRDVICQTIMLALEKGYR